METVSLVFEVFQVCNTIRTHWFDSQALKEDLTLFADVAKAVMTFIALPGVPQDLLVRLVWLISPREFKLTQADAAVVGPLRSALQKAADLVLEAKDLSMFKALYKGLRSKARTHLVQISHALQPMQPLVRSRCAACA